MKQTLRQLVDQQSAIHAGGPGSGRHPEAGKFEKTGGRGHGRFGGSSTFYKAPSGEKITVTRRGTGSQGTTTVHEVHPDQPFMMHPKFSGKQDAASNFLGARYGIIWKGKK